MYENVSFWFLCGQLRVAEWWKWEQLDVYGLNEAMAKDLHFYGAMRCFMIVQ